MDVNEGRNPNNPTEYDQVNIICPLYDKRLVPDESDTEQYVIYNVNREEFDMCNIMRNRPTIIAVCNRPYQLTFFTISFRSFSPSPGAIEYRPGKDYYFISTSARGDIHLRNGGMCRSHNMKMIFKVSDGKTKPKSAAASSSDNQVQSSTLMPSIKQSPEAEDKHGSRRNRKNRKRKNRNNRKNNKHLYDQDNSIVISEEDSDTLVVDPPFVENSAAVMNDKPRRKMRKQEPGLVEKVNNLMNKHEYSPISGGGSSATIHSQNLVLLPILLTLSLFFKHRHL